jgi:hypothetical protein
MLHKLLLASDVGEFLHLVITGNAFFDVAVHTKLVYCSVLGFQILNLCGTDSTMVAIKIAEILKYELLMIILLTHAASLEVVV